MCAAMGYFGESGISHKTTMATTRRYLREDLQYFTEESFLQICIYMEYFTRGCGQPQVSQEVDH